MKVEKYLYNLNYKICEDELCAIEIRSLFDFELQDKVFFSNKEIDPSISPFLKNRLEIIYKASSFSELVNLVKEGQIYSPEFLVRYVALLNNDSYIKRGREFSKEIGLLIGGPASYSSPKTVYGIGNYKGVWYFGFLLKNNYKWKQHNLRPYSYSSSLSINIAKVLVNIAGKGDLSKKIIDPCCGVGTVMFEGFFAGYSIKGGEKNCKVACNARHNLRHFNYPPDVITGDIQNIKENFDVSIVDLPYGISSTSSLEHQNIIIKSAKKISKKVVLVSSTDIREDLLKFEFKIMDTCKIFKTENRKFARYIWVCE